MRVIKWILKWFMPEPEDAIEEVEIEDGEEGEELEIDEDQLIENPTISLLFQLNDKAEIGMDFNWEREDSRTGQMLGEFFHMLCSGFMQQDINNVMMQWAIENPESSEFVHKVFKTWNKVSNADSPVISPLAALKMEIDKQ